VDFKKNGFWIGLGGGVAVAALVFGLLVLPQWSEESTLRETVQAQHLANLDRIAAGGKAVPTEAWATALEAHDKAVNEDSKKLYQGFAAADAAGEAWFDDKEPQKGVLMSKASDGILKMLADLRVKLGKDYVPADGRATLGDQNMVGFEFPTSDQVKDDPEDKRKFMRWYNIHARMKDVVLESDVKRFYKVQFSQITYPQEFNLQLRAGEVPNGLGETIPFLFDCSLLWKDVPKLMASVLKYDPAARAPMFRISAIRIERDPVEKIVPEIKEEVDEETYNPATWVPKTQPSEDKYAPVRVYMLIEAYNFSIPEARLK
jgi:hypothetical protein